MAYVRARHPQSRPTPAVKRAVTAHELARRRMYRRRRITVLSAFLVLLLGGYAALDANDVVPGVLTREPGWPQAQPFPTAAAVLATAAPERVSSTSQDAPIPSAEALATLSDELVKSGSVGSAPGILVTDLATGEDIYSARASEGYVPASSLKVLTAVAVMSSYGDTHKFTTSVVDSGDGVITLVGGGDLTLAAGPGGSDVIGRAGLADLAEEVAKELKSQDRTDVSLTLDDGLFTGPKLAPGWGDADISGGWAMPISALAIDIGRQEGTNVRSLDAGMDAAKVFAQALAKQGIAVSSDIERAAAADGAAELGSVASAPLRDIVAYTLQYSDNVLSEALGRMTAVKVGAEASFSGAGESVLAMLADLGLDTAGTSLVDTSGLSSQSKVTPRLLTDTVQLVANGSHPQLRSVVDALPVAGLEGTLEDRLHGSDATGAVRAKTGTLPRVVALSGVLTTVDARVLSFTVLANDFPKGSAYLARVAVDEWITGIAECGCTK